VVYTGAELLSLPMRAAIYIKNMKAVRVTEHISFAGLPQLSALIKPTAKA
jgi:hypothetical protein